MKDSKAAKPEARPISKAAEMREARVREQMFGHSRYSESFVTQEAKGELLERGGK